LYEGYNYVFKTARNLMEIYFFMIEYRLHIEQKDD